MLPFVLLLLVQSIAADRFPNLTQNITLEWNRVNISLLDGSQTVSEGSKVPTFTICGDFQSEQKDVTCGIHYQGERSNDYVNRSSSGYVVGNAKYLSQRTDSKGNNYTCMAFDNPLSEDFIWIYDGLASGKAFWKVTYLCKDHFYRDWILATVGFLLSIVLFCCCCMVCVIRHERKKYGYHQSSIQNADTSYHNHDPAHFSNENNPKIKAGVCDGCCGSIFCCSVSFFGEISQP